MENKNGKRIRSLNIAVVSICLFAVVCTAVTGCSEKEKNEVAGKMTPTPTVTGQAAPLTEAVQTLTPVEGITSTPAPTDTLAPTPTDTPVPTATSTPLPTSTPIPVATSTPIPTRGPLSHYDEAFNGDCFIGDSRTDGIFLYSGISTADFLCEVSLNLNSAMTSSEVKNALQNNSYRNIYIQFGVNEMTWRDPDLFQAKYTEFVNMIKSYQPNATIYVESVIPVTQHKSNNSDCFNLTYSKSYDESAKKTAEATGTVYLDVTAGICGPDRILPSEASGDGVHLDVAHTFVWLDSIINNR